MTQYKIIHRRNWWILRQDRPPYWEVESGPYTSRKLCQANLERLQQAAQLERRAA